MGLETEPGSTLWPEIFPINPPDWTAEQRAITDAGEWEFFVRDEPAATGP